MIDYAWACEYLEEHGFKYISGVACWDYNGDAEYVVEDFNPDSSAIVFYPELRLNTDPDYSDCLFEGTADSEVAYTQDDVIELVNQVIANYEIAKKKYLETKIKNICKETI